MQKQMKNLQRLEGIGEVMARRLVEANYDTISKLAAAEKKRLEKIVGMHPQRAQTIISHARRMTGFRE